MTIPERLSDTLMDRRRFLQAAGAAGLGTVLAACAPAPAPQAPAKQPAAGEKPAGQLKTLRVGHGQPPADITPVLFLPFMRQNVLKNVGKVYEATMTFILGTNLHATALAAGEQDIVILDFLVAALSLEKGLLKDIALLSNVKLDGHPQYRGNVYRVMANSGINSVADLKGKTITTVTIGQSIDLAFKVAARKAGLDPDKDVKIVEMGFDAVGPALREGRVACGPFIPPFDALEAAKGGMKDLFTLRDVFGPNEQLMHAAKKDFLKANEREVKAFFEDKIIGLKWLLDPANRAKAIETMSETYKVPKATYELFFATNKDDYRQPDGCVSKNYLQKPLDILAEQGYAPKRDLTGLVDNSYLPNPQACANYA